MSESQIIKPEGWPTPSGYANGMAANGRMIAVAGQIGWNPITRKFRSEGFVDQVRTALQNVAAVLEAAGAAPKDVIRMTWFITDRNAYLENTKAIGDAYRDVFGRHYPAMSVIVVSGLIEEQAKVEIEATAVA